MYTTSESGLENRSFGFLPQWEGGDAYVND